MAELKDRAERVIRAYRKEVVDAQQELERLADMAIELFARLRAREHACRGEQLDRHVAQPLRAPSAASTISFRYARITPSARSFNSATCFSKYSLCDSQPLVQLDVERPALSPSRAPRSAIAAYSREQAEILQRPPERARRFP